MKKIISISKLPRLIKKIKQQRQAISLVGGCFDILHPGHVIFLQKAKQTADILLVMLEPDQKVKLLKGVDRPVHNQKERALVLEGLQAVDYILPLPFMTGEKEYNKVIEIIRPDIIAATEGSEALLHQKSAEKVGAQFKYVTKIAGHYSSTRILNHNK